MVSQAEHAHVELFCFAAIDLNRSSTFELELEIIGADATTILPGLFSPQHRHFAWVTSLSAIQESHFHFDCFCLAAMDLKTSSTVAVTPLLDEIDALVLVAMDDGAVVAVVESLLPPQHTHLVAEFSFGVKHDEHDHLFCVCLAASAFNVSSHLFTDFIITDVGGICLADVKSIFFGSVDVVDVVGFDIDIDFIRIGSLNL